MATLQLELERDLTRVWERHGYIRYYHPRRRGLNRSFGPSDQFILDLKDGSEEAIKKAVADFSRTLCQLCIKGDTILVMVPGHQASPSNRRSPLARVILQLSEQLPEFISAHDVLIRTKEIDQLCSGGNRHPDVHRASITLQWPTRVEGMTVVVLDDVVTTGNSIFVCREKLLEAGAARVGALALGKTYCENPWYP